MRKHLSHGAFFLGDLNRRHFLQTSACGCALLSVGELSPLLAPRMRVGPFVQELLTYRRATQLRLVRQAQELGLDALGFCLWPIVPGGVEIIRYPVPYAGYDLSRPTVPYQRRLHETVSASVAAGIRPYVYGPMFPDLRRYHPMFERMRFGGRGIRAADWATWSPLAHDAWSHFLLRIHAEYGDALRYVDGVEPFTRYLPPPPNHFTAQMRQALPGILSAGIHERHFNPGDSDIPHARVVASDGWGRSTRRWHWGRPTTGTGPVHRPLAGLPGDRASPSDQRGAEAQVAQYFVTTARVAWSQGARMFLVLHTAGWSVANGKEAKAQAANPDNYQGHPAVVSLHAPPFGRIYQELAAA